jgi:hypothetical protein
MSNLRKAALKLAQSVMTARRATTAIPMAY